MLPLKGQSCSPNNEISSDIGGQRHADTRHLRGTALERLSPAKSYRMLAPPATAATHERQLAHSVIKNGVVCRTLMPVCCVCGYRKSR